MDCADRLPTALAVNKVLSDFITKRALMAHRSTLLAQGDRRQCTCVRAERIYRRSTGKLV